MSAKRASAKAAKGAGSDPNERVVATNRRARHDYEILDTIECGIVLRGSEVKSLREAKVTLADAYARITDHELWLLGLHISPYSHGAGFDPPDPERDRKLLAHRTEIDRLGARLDREALTRVPLRLYFSKGRAKIQLGLGRGKWQYDKRQDLARRDADREAERAMARGRRGE
jgi:SsrA-binding protein